MRSIALLYLLWMGVLAGACSRSPASGAPVGQDHGPPAIPIRAAKAEQRKLNRSVEISGSLLSPEDATIGAEVEGKIVSLRVDLGDRVKEGDVLARISPEEYRLRMVQAEAQRVQADANLRRAEQLAKADMVAKREYDDAQSAAAQSSAAADLARKKFRDTIVRAPFSGVVARRLVSTGEYIKIGQPLFQIVVLDPLKLVGEVPERYLAVVNPGDPVAVHVDAFQGQTFSGKLSRVSPAVNPQSRSFIVEARIDNLKSLLKPGIFARAEISIGGLEDVVVIPESAVSSFAGVTKVFVIENDIARERVVEIDRHLEGGWVTLAKGDVKPGDSVATAGLGRLAEGVKVAIK